MNTRGSEWHKWDLHFHTPSSFDYEDKSITNDVIIQQLLAKQISVVAITDHHKIDVERINELSKIGKPHGITVLPGIEFRSELGGSEVIHFIGIFSELSNIGEIWTDIQSKCNLKPSEIAKVGDEKFYSDLKDTAKLIHDLGGLVSVHAGKKSNTIENIRNNKDYKLQIKTDLLSEFIDILEIGDVSVDVEGYEKIVFPSLGFKRPLIICSDNHNVKQYNFKENCWIKADTTFEGLKQILFEPNERVRLQERNPFSDYQRPYFSKITINNSFNVFANQNLKFDNCSIPLNQNLVTIIGGRGEGKSILMDFFATGFGYASNQYQLSNDFEVNYTKSYDGEKTIYQLGEKHNLSFLYIKQNEVKDLSLDAQKLGNEIKRMLNLDTIEDFDVEIQDSIKQELDKLKELKKWFEQTNDNGTKINNADVVKSVIKKNQDLLTSITDESNKEKLEKYTNNVKDIKQGELRIVKLNDLERKLDEYSISTNQTIQEINESIPLIDFSLQKEKIKEISLAITKSITACQLSNEKIKEEFSEIYKGDLSSLLENADKYKRNIEGLKSHLENINKKQIEFNQQLDVRKNLCDIVLKELNTQVDLINNSWSNLLRGKSDWTPKQKEIIKKILTDKSISIEGKIFFDTKIFYENLRNCINGRYWRNKNKEGELETFFGITDHISFANFLKNRYSEIEDTPDNYVFPDIEKLFYDSSQRVKYLYVQPEITFRTKKLNQISVGQRGTVYLCLKLATDTFSTPILFDQPEDDLDNQFITDELIDIFRDLKKFRQVVIITHNANLVVNTDAEQVIVAKNTNEILSYKSGSIENPFIVDKVCRILEGGKKAFENRRNKYRIEIK